MTEAIASADTSRNNLLMVAAGGLVSGILTPLLPTLIDHLVGLPGQFRISLIAVPFAVLVFVAGAAIQRQSALGGGACRDRHHDCLCLRGERGHLYRGADRGRCPVMRICSPD